MPQVQKSAFIINFHGIGDASRPYEPGEQPFWISRQEFTDILDLVQSKSEAVDFQLTFDDGNSSDCGIAAPELRQRGLHAIFFVLAGKLDVPGYLTRHELRDLVAQGFGVGSHGLNHVDWSGIEADELARELSESRSILEGVIGQPVTAAAIPFGRYDRRVLSALGRSGYRHVYSSDGGARLSTTWPIPRYSVSEGIQPEQLAAMAQAGSITSRLRNEARLRLKASLLGSTMRRLKRLAD